MEPRHGSGTKGLCDARQRIDLNATVREVVYYTAQLQLPNSIPVYEKREMAKMAIRAMYLD